MRMIEVFGVAFFFLSGAVTATNVFASDASKSLSKQCGAATMTIQCSPGSAACTQTMLTIRTAGGKARTLDKPKGMGAYTPVGLACASANHEAYFVVQYGERPRGCAFCEWYHLYTVEGKALTHSDPPILTDTTLPPARQPYPNNKAYDDMAKRLGLIEQDVEFLR